MDVSILGPLLVTNDGVELDLGPRKQRMLLADLALSAPRVVATDRLLEDLWGDEASDKQSALWVYISRLRSILEPDREQRGPATVLVTSDHGYALAIDSDAVDARRFERDAARGALLLREDPAAASRVLRDALGEWRGDVLEEFVYEDFARPEIVRLTELRLGALENRISADLELGAAGRLVGEIEALCTDHPLRERLVGQLMLALYRSGRQADALRSFERFRTRIAEELGLDPSPELRRLEEQVLVHDERVQPRTPAAKDGSHSGATPNPFKGLRAFTEDDGAVFFGRERVVADVLRRIADGASFVALVGPSGSGKSSILRAGVVPAIRKGSARPTEHWVVASMVPGAHPFAELEAGLLRSSLDTPDSLGGQLSDPSTGFLRAALRVLPHDEARLLLIIDQFEELFTLVDGEVRTRFLDQLVPLIDDPHGRVVVAISLRADFYARPLSHRAIGARLGDAVVNVVPMQPDELEAAAQEPAARSHVSLEPALLATLVGDVIGEPGALPLFQYALTELVDRRTGDTLTLEDYRAIGGVDGALGARAEDLYQDLDAGQQQAARQFFLRLVTLGDGEEWSRRRVAAAEIAALDADIVAVQVIIERYTRHRLLTRDRDRVSGGPTIEVAHEALLTEWDRLRGWISDTRADLHHHAALRLAIAEWEEAGRHGDYLLTGERLRAHITWIDRGSLRLTATERDYIEASVVASRRTSSAEAERAAEESRLLSVARWRLRALVGLLVLALGGGTALVAVVLAPDDPRVALVYTGRDGNTIARQIGNGFDQAERDLDIRAETLVPVTDAAAEINDLLKSAPDLVIISGQIATDWEVDLAAVASGHPEITFAIINLGGVVASLLPANATTVSFDSAEGGFLAGAAAASETRTGTVGFVGGLPFVIDDFRLGFEAGARHVDPEVVVLSEYLGPGGLDVFMDPGPAQDAAARLYAAGADIVFHAAGDAGLGVHRAAMEQSEVLGRQLWGMGVDGDQWLQVDTDVRDHVLTSLLKHHDRAVGEAIAAFLDGSLGDIVLGAGDGGFFLSDSGNHLSPATTDAVTRAADALAHGQVRIAPHVSTPATHGAPPDATWALRHDGTICSGTLPASATAEVGDRVTIEVRNDSSSAVDVGVWPPGGLDLPPWSLVVAAAGGNHALSFQPTYPGVWEVRCFEDTDEPPDTAVSELTVSP